MRLMALIPALDAAGTIGPIIEGVKRLQVAGAVVVVDDGSVDGTQDIALKHGAKVIRHEVNLGKGMALKTGFAYAIENGYDGVISLDADGQHSPADIPRLVDAAKPGASGSGPAIVIGARAMDKDKFPPARYYPNKVGVAFLSWRSGARLDDSQSGFRFYRMDVIRDIRIDCERFDAESEILIKVGRSGHEIVSIPISTIYTEAALNNSHYRAVPDTWSIVKVFFRSFFWSRR